MEFYRRPLPETCVSFSSDEGKKLFLESMTQGHMECYFRLAAQLRTQDDPAFCGLATLVMALNALEIDPKRVWKGPWRWYHEEMLDCCADLDSIRKKGITFSQFACLAECNGLSVVAKCIADSCAKKEEFENLVKETTANDNRVLVVSYSRKVLKQTGSGHFAAIGGYHPGKDMVLLFDTARFKYPPHWVTLDLIWEAMKMIDPETGLNRGYLVLEKADNKGLSIFRVCEKLNTVLLSGEDTGEGDAVNNQIKKAWDSWAKWLDEPCIVGADESDKVLEAAADTLLSNLCVNDCENEYQIFFLRLQIGCQDLKSCRTKTLTILEKGPFGSRLIGLLMKNDRWKGISKLIKDCPCHYMNDFESIHVSIVAFLLSYPYESPNGTWGKALGKICEEAKAGIDDEAVVNELRGLSKIFSILIHFNQRS